MNLFPEIATNTSSKNLFNINRVKHFVITLLQLLLVFLILNQFQLASQSGITAVAPIILIAFTLYSFIPIRFKPFIFSLTSFTIIYYAFGWFQGSLIIGGGLVILACCHLPLKHLFKIILILLIFGGLAYIRSNQLYVPRAVAASSYIAAMFMFRVFLYLYELKHNSIHNATLWQRIGYFFMFPNNLFLLFPIVDYKAYINSFYQQNEKEFWQKGIRWILRGIVHLLIYQLIYNNWVITKTEVVDLNSLLLHANTNYLLIFRLSGMFHLVVGLLCLFGFSLHPIFNNYFLATSFVNLWRRINIYWREFIMKLFFYPLFFKLKGIKQTYRLPITMLLMFFITWILHNYQWFWIRGSFPISVTDALFWIIIGSCVTVNSIIEARRVRKKIAKPKPNTAYHIISILKMLGLFLFMSVMWTLWSSKTLNEWFYLLSTAQHFSTQNLLYLFIILVAIISVGLLAYQLIKINSIKNLIHQKPSKTIYLTLPALILLATISNSTINSYLPQIASVFTHTITNKKLNEANKQELEQGYYEKLLDGEGKNVTSLWEIEVKRTKTFSPLDEVAIRTTNLLTRTLKPNANIMLNGINLKTNRSGYRDKNYSLIPNESTTRFALIGGSYEMGMGVDKDKTFEYLVEEKLNQQAINNNIEILNFSMGGYHLIQQVEQIKSDTIFQYQPNFTLYFAHTDDKRRLLRFVADLIQNGTNLKYPFLIQVKKTSGAKQTMSRIEIEQRLKPYIGRIVKWAYAQIAKEAYSNKSKPIWLYLPATADEFKTDEFNELKTYAKKYGFITIDLIGIYDNIDVKTIQLAAWDTHPNEKGHQLIANKITEVLLKHKKELKLN